MNVSGGEGLKERQRKLDPLHYHIFGELEEHLLHKF